MRADRGDLPVKVGHSSRMACSCSVVSARVEQERLYVCVCLYVYMDMYVNMYIYVCIYIYICMYTCICVYLYIYVLYIYLYNLCDRV